MFSDNRSQIGDSECGFLGVRLTVFPDFWELYDRLRTMVVGDQTERRLLELRLGKDVRASR